MLKGSWRRNHATKWPCRLQTSKTIVFQVITVLFLLQAASVMIAYCEEATGGKEATPPFWWMEVGSDIGYQRTNKWFTTQKDFGLSRLNTDAGFRIYLQDDKKSWFLDPYVDEELLYDLGSKIQNKFFWNNDVKYGPGLRLRWEYKDQDAVNKPDEPHGLRINYLNVDTYGEYLGISFIDRGEGGAPETVPTKDALGGFRSYLSADNKIAGNNGIVSSWGFWFENWTDFTYHSTNFYTKGMDNFVILTLSPKAGLRASLPDPFQGVALEPYFRYDYVYDFLNNDWNKQPWWNNTDYGPGFRLSLGGWLTKRTGTNIYLYAEHVNVTYPSRVGWRAAGLANYDTRAGINLWIPLGASVGSHAPGP